MNKQKAEELSGLTFQDGWTYQAITRAGQTSGFVMIRGNELHVWRSPDFAGRWFTRQDLERTIGPLIHQFGHVTTKVRASNDTGKNFVTRLGFVPTGTEDGQTYFIAEKFNHARH